MNDYNIFQDPNLNLFAMMEQLLSFPLIYYNDSGDGYSIYHEPHSNPLDNVTIYPPSPPFIEQQVDMDMNQFVRYDVIEPLQADMDMNQFIPYDVIEPPPEAPVGHMSNTSLYIGQFP